MNWSNSTVLSVNLNIWHIIIITESCFVIIRLSSLIEIVSVLMCAWINLIAMLFILVHIHFKFTLLAHTIDARLWRNLLKLLATCTLSHVTVPGVWWFSVFFFNFFNDIRHFVINNVSLNTSHIEQSSSIILKLVITWSKLSTTYLWCLKMLPHVQWSLFQLVCFKS
mgnify:CR=1 FL=1